MAAMEQLEWAEGTWVQVPTDEPSDEAIRLVIHDYGNTVVTDTGTHYFPPYVQTLDVDGETFVTWYAQSFDVSAPESWVLKRAVLRQYIEEVLEGRLLG